MCGFVGQVSQQKIDADRVIMANQHNARRGPDEAGHHISDNLVLASRRLAISGGAYGKQPATYEDNLLVFNGELFGLSKVIKYFPINDRPDTESDTFLLVRLLSKYGVEILPFLNGMFSFAFFDRSESTLTIGRDQFGIKPLFYGEDSSSMFFSTSLMSVRDLLFEPPKLCHDSISHFLRTGFIPPNKSIYSNVLSLSPGFTYQFCLRSGERRLSTYKKRAYKPVKMSEREVLESLSGLLNDSVDRWTPSEQPYAWSASSGIDSNLLISYEGVKRSERMYVGGYSNSRLKNLDESRDTLAYANYFGLPLSFVDCEISPGVFSEILAANEAPISDAFAIFNVFKEISNEYRVALSGTAGDELFSQYGYGEFLRGPLVSKKHFEESYFLKRYGKYVRMDSLTKEIFRTNNFNDDYALDLQFEVFSKEYEATGDTDWALMQLMLCQQLPGDFLRYTDTLSSYFGLEIRTPYLDADLVDFVCTVPSHIRIDDGRPKKLLATLLHARTGLRQAAKKGLNPPLSVYCRNGFQQDLDYVFSTQELLEIPQKKQLLERISRGEIESLYLTWRLYSLFKYTSQMDRKG